MFFSNFQAYYFLEEKACAPRLLRGSGTSLFEWEGSGRRIIRLAAGVARRPAFPVLPIDLGSCGSCPYHHQVPYMRGSTDRRHRSKASGNLFFFLPPSLTFYIYYIIYLRKKQNLKGNKLFWEKICAIWRIYRCIRRESR